MSQFLTGALSGVTMTGLAIIMVRAGVPLAQAIVLGLALWFILALGLARIF